MIFNFLRNTYQRWIPLITNLSDCSYNNSNSESDIFIFNNENFSCCYVGEPEHNEEELKSRTFSGDSKNESNDRDEDDCLNSSIYENLYWCLSNIDVVESFRVYSMTSLKSNQI